MNSRLPSSARPDLQWIHDGLRHRATVWPDVRFEREIAPDQWEACDLSEAALASAAATIGDAAWRRYLEFVAPAERHFLEEFRFGRMAALQVLRRCPALLDELTPAPALTAFVSAHLSLRGGDEPAWAEINAIHERDGLFGLLQWLGLPASRQTMTILRHIAEPDLPSRLLEPLRAALWEPETLWALLHEPRLTDARIAATCHALAA